MGQGDGGDGYVWDAWTVTVKGYCGIWCCAQLSAQSPQGRLLPPASAPGALPLIICGVSLPSLSPNPTGQCLPLVKASFLSPSDLSSDNSDLVMLKSLLAGLSLPSRDGRADGSLDEEGEGEWAGWSPGGSGCPLQYG